MPCGKSRMQHDRRGEQRHLAEDRRGDEGRDLVDGAEQRRGRDGAGNDRRAAADDGDEGLGDIGDADGGKDAGDRRQHAAGKAGERRADAEGDGIDARAA